MDRRTTLLWVIAASAALPLIGRRAGGSDKLSGDTPFAKGYGSDPNLLKDYVPGELWPLTFTPSQRAIATELCDLIIPIDTQSPSASAVGVVDFLDEWVSAPYPQQVRDRKLFLEGFAWLDAESQLRFKHAFGELTPRERMAICDDICYAPNSEIRFGNAARFFARFRDLTAGGFYTTPQGTKDLQYMGNVPSLTFEGPPLEVLKRVGLA